MGKTLVYLLLICLSVNNASTVSKDIANGREDFHPDCADPHNKEIACTAHKVDCDVRLFEPVDETLRPPEPFDLRVEALAKSSSRNNNRNHELHVDVSWQMPPRNKSVLLKAFKLEIDDIANKKLSCFVFNVTRFSYDDVNAAPRFRFSSESLFNFKQNYTVKLYSLPQTSKPKFLSKTSTMPVDPEDKSLNVDDWTQYCINHVPSVEASKWTAGFRKIFLQALTRTIQIEFVGAPPQFCFEQYEVRLLDEDGVALLHHAVINFTDMKKEVHGGKVVYFGEHNFTDLELETNYIPSVIPIDTSSTGKCLCPTSMEQGACSCIAADWKQVKLRKIEQPVSNSTVPNLNYAPDANKKTYTIAYVLLVLLGLTIVLLCCGFATILFCRKYQQRGKAVRIRFISDHVRNGNGMVMAEPRSPLIYNPNTSILLVYTHDCPQHESVVLAFAELLRNVFHFDVHLDVWDASHIESNRHDYINSSIVRADKMLIINSVGTFMRMRARQLGEDPIERVNGGPFDSLFSQQIELALQHARLVSTRFVYSPSTCTTLALTPLLQYTVPDNLGLLIASLTDSQQRNDPRLNGFTPELSRLNAAISRMSLFVQSDPKWFEKLHHRIPSMISKQPTITPAVTQSVDSGIDSGPCTGTREVKVPISLTLTSEDEDGIIVATSPMDYEDVPLLEMETPQSENRPEIVIEDKDECTNVEDSSYFSGPLSGEQQQQQQQQQSYKDVTDKPRAIVPELMNKLGELDDHQLDSGMVSDLISS